MASSKEVFSLRKQGLIDEAYAMACQLIADDPDDDWNKRALGWCLYDLVKQHVAKDNYPMARRYSNELDSLEIDELDDILWKSREQARLLATPERRIILEAKEKSKAGNHQAALDLFRQAVREFPNDIDLHNQFAWELQKEGKLIFDTDKVDLTKARKLLAEYISLKNERPATVHSLFLRMADKITDREEFNLIAFLKMWDLNNLMDSDYERFTKDDKTFPALAEKTIQHAAKLILDKRQTSEVAFILPFIDVAIKHYPDNIWLPYYKAKLLHLIGRNTEAIQFLKPVIKEKISDYWCWSLLAELLTDIDRQKALSCYCKALLCSGEEKFLANVRLKFSELLIKSERWQEAKYEILTAMSTKELEGGKVPEKFISLRESEWYKSAQDNKDNLEFYRKNKALAEEFIFEDLLWLDACVGETFTVPEKPGKLRRKLYVKLQDDIVEFTTSDRRFSVFKKAKPGDSLKVKGELDKEKKFQLYLLEVKPNEEPWSIFEWREGNVLQPIRDEKQKVYAWGLNVSLNKQSIDCTIKTESLPLDARHEGAAVYVKVHVKRPATPTSIFSQVRPGKTNAVAAKLRVAEAWDLIPEHVGIVDHVNQEKGVAHFIVSKEISGTVKLNSIPVDITLGMRLKVRVRKIKKGLESYYSTLSVKDTDEEPESKLLRKFSGRIELSGLVGFCDDVFVERDLINTNNLKDGLSITGTAILNYNKKRLKWGWKALSIESVNIDGAEIPVL